VGRLEKAIFLKTTSLLVGKHRLYIWTPQTLFVGVNVGPCCFIGGCPWV